MRKQESELAIDSSFLLSQRLMFEEQEIKNIEVEIANVSQAYHRYLDLSARLREHCSHRRYLQSMLDSDRNNTPVAWIVIRELLQAIGPCRVAALLKEMSKLGIVISRQSAEMEIKRHPHIFSVRIIGDREKVIELK